MRVAELAPGDVFGGYRVLSRLGEGGMGIVYLAEHIGLGRKVALKLLPPQLASDPRFRERFIRESRTAASLDHPNVIPIYEAGESDGRLFLAMRYVDGTDLNRILHDRGRLEPTRALRILKQVAGALDAAHERGLVHRDVKPANVMLTAGSGTEEHVYLTDFGLTKRMASESGITDTGQFVGSLDYAAPEQFEGGTLTPATDLYSLGAVLYECLTGEPPFRREQDAAVMFAHLLAPVPKVTDSRAELLPGIDQVLARAMAKKPEERYSSGAQLVTAAADALDLQGEEYRIPTSRLRRIVGARRSRKRRRFTVRAVAVTLAVALVAVVLPRVIGGGAPRFQAGIVLLDPKTGKQTGFVSPSQVARPVAARYADGHFWLFNLEPASFVEVDAKMGNVLTQVAAPVPDIGGFAVEGNTLWFTAGNELVKMDTTIGREVDRFDLDKLVPGEGGDLSGVTTGAGSVWVGRDVAPQGQIVRLDSASGQVQHVSKDTFGRNHSLAYGEGSLWAADRAGIARIDSEANTTTVANDVSGNFDVAEGGGFGWTSDESKGVVYKLDRTARVVGTYTTGLGATGMSFSDGVLWVANQDVGTVAGIDAVTGKLSTYRLGHPVGSVAAGGGVLLVLVGEGRTFEDTIGALTGKVARLFTPLGQLFDQADPAIDGAPGVFEVEYATCAKLLNYPDKPPPDGWQLQPEVATGMPAVSSDGRTYTFTIGSGYRFSPPSNQPVTAETFRHTIERALSPKMGDGAPGRQFVDDIEGEQAFLDGKAEHISGLQVTGDRLRITLVRPSANFLVRLSLPFFCPVPTNTAMVPGASSISRTLSSDGQIPAAGPYYVADRVGAEFVILKRNPNYRGPRPHALDAIVLREGVDSGLAVDRVQDEGWEGITNVRLQSGVNFQDSTFDPESTLASQWGPSSAAARRSDQRYYPVLDGGVGFIEFNTNRPLFSDSKVREAASLALDRRLLGHVLATAVPAWDLLPPNLPGVSTTSGAEPPVPDLDRARQLMDGRTAEALMAIDPPDRCPSCAQLAEVVKSELRQIEIDVRIKVVPQETSSYGYAHESGSPVDIRYAQFNADAYELVDLSHYLSDFMGYADWWPADVRKAAQRLTGLDGADLDAGVLAWMAMLKDQAVLAPVAHLVSPAYFSPNLGCRVFPPFGWGVDLAALCLMPQS
jgi:ABC-type oligopeptide transport system substrate-binding subunit